METHSKLAPISFSYDPNNLLLLPCFQEWQDVPGLSCLFPALVLQSIISPTSASICSHNVGARGMNCYWIVIASGFFQDPKLGIVPPPPLSSSQSLMKKLIYSWFNETNSDHASQSV